MPVLLWLPFKYWKDDSKRRERYLRYIMFEHLAVWAPTIVLGFLVSMGSMRGFAATWLRHYSSNMNKVAYDYAKWTLFFLAIVEGGGWNWSLFFFYWIYKQLVATAEQGSGTFAIYYLDPEDMTLDAELYPSIGYLFGIREHRYRYYYYYPEYTPDFSLLDEEEDEPKEEKAEKKEEPEAKEAVSDDEEEAAVDEDED